MWAGNQPLSILVYSNRILSAGFVSGVVVYITGKFGTELWLS